MSTGRLVSKQITSASATDAAPDTSTRSKSTHAPLQGIVVVVAALVVVVTVAVDLVVAMLDPRIRF